MACIRERVYILYGTLLPNIPFRLAEFEHPLPPAPSGTAALRSPVDHRGTHPQQVGDGAAGVSADFQGKVGKALTGTSVEARLPRHLNPLHKDHSEATSHRTGRSKSSLMSQEQTRPLIRGDLERSFFVHFHGRLHGSRLPGTRSAWVVP